MKRFRLIVSVHLMLADDICVFCPRVVY